MSDNYICVCGERVDPKGTPHRCPGTPQDRIEDLEQQVAELNEVVFEVLLPRLAGDLSDETWRRRIEELRNRYDT